ncbi:MAG: hypothetical protein GX260_03800 [Tissierellia bacterium]|nr:hypothetical protein [Bacillota bacterium]NLL22887.1 hypothetical protein [Tissierellia bacterium]
MIIYLFILAMLTWTDIIEKKIPDEWIVAGCILRFIMGETLRSQWFCVVFILCIFAHFGLGWGDVKLGMLIYMSRGAVFERFLLTFCAAACFSVFSLILNKATKKSQLPLAPFFIGTELFFL